MKPGAGWDCGQTAGQKVKKRNSLNSGWLYIHTDKLMKFTSTKVKNCSDIYITEQKHRATAGGQHKHCNVRLFTEGIPLHMKNKGSFSVNMNEF